MLPKFAWGRARRGYGFFERIKKTRSRVLSLLVASLLIATVDVYDIRKR